MSRARLQATPSNKAQAMRENAENIGKLEKNYKKWITESTTKINGRNVKGDVYDLKSLERINPHKAFITAQLMENFAMKAKRFDEATISTQFGTRPENFLKLIRIGVANSYRADFADEVALTTTDDAYYFLDRVYGRTLRGATAGDFIYESATPDSPSEYQLEDVDLVGAGVAYAGIIAGLTPIIPFHVAIFVNGTQVAIDNGMGQLVGSTLDPNAPNTIDYQTGGYAINFLAAPNARIEIRTNFNSELDVNFNLLQEVDLSLRKIRFNVRPFSVGYNYSLMTQVFMDKTLGSKAEENLLLAVADEMARARDFRAIRFMNQIARKNPEETFDANFATFGGVNYIDHAQRILQKISRIEDRLYNDIHRGEVNVLIATPAAVSYFMLNNQWKGFDVSSGSKIGVYPVGELAGKKVFKVPADASLGLIDGDVLLNMKSGISEMDTGVIFGTLSEAETKLTYPEGNTVGRLFSLEDAREVNGRFLRKLHISNIDSSF